MSIQHEAFEVGQRRQLPPELHQVHNAVNEATDGSIPSPDPHRPFKLITNKDYASPKHKALKGADFLLVELHDQVHLTSQPAHISILGLLTFRGRIPYEQALDSLTPFEQRVIEQTAAQPDMRLTSIESMVDLSDNSCVVIHERRIGHVSILTPDEVNNYELTEPYFIAGKLQFPSEQQVVLTAYKQESELDFLKQAQEAASALKTMEQDGRLQPVIANIRENLMRIGPTFVHIGHHIYSTFDQVGKNLIDRNPEGGTRLLSVVAHQPVEEWRPEDQVYVYGTHLLLLSGGAFRIEEFNGGQLRLDLLQKFFDRKAELYTQAVEEHMPDDWKFKTMEEKALWLGQKLPEINSQRQRYRTINGLNIRQEERIMDLLTHPSGERIREMLSDRIGAIFGIGKTTQESDQGYWQRVTQDVIQQHLSDPKTENVSPLPLLLWSIIQTAVDSTQSDFGMSSTFRDAHQLKTTGPLNLDKRDFFCCVVPSHKLVKLQESAKITKAMNLMANRMEFNRWHFIPSNLKREETPPSRDWFYSPAIPDIASEIEWHHGGHVDAGVHHSLRFPSSITVEGKKYIGAYDIRLLRQKGESYTPDDIKTAHIYLDALGAVLNTVVKFVEETNQPVRIDAFTPQWYKDLTWIYYIDKTAA